MKSYSNMIQRLAFVADLNNMVGPCMYDTTDDEENGVFTVKFITGGEVKFNYIPKHEEKDNNDTQCD